MFYSQAFLARKGPLSTVWIAAHLQHRLKKSHYTSIESTVDHILDPGVPIALRMSGHLLLGVVRIYSKKVDCLFHDCNVILTSAIKAFASVQLTLPEDARQAPVQSITLPDTFDLDAVNLDDEPEHTGIEDIHQRCQEEITLTDRIPIQMHHYIAISFDEDMMVDSSHTEVLPDSGPTPMEDVIRQSPLTNVGFQDGGPSIQRELPTAQLSAGECDEPSFVPDPEGTSDLGPGDDPTPQATLLKSIEVGRNANDYNVENPSIKPVPEDQDTEPIGVRDETMNEKDLSPETIDEGMAVQSPQHFGPSTPATSQEAASDAQVGGPSKPNLVLHASPSIQQPQRRGRKRKQFFDEPIVLTNKFMREALNNPRDILRKRRGVPSSTLDTWKLNNSRKKEQTRNHPLLTGLCKDLLDISKREYICSKSNLVISEEDHEDVGIARTPPTNQIGEEPRPVTPTVTSPAVDMEIEHLRSVAASPPLAVLGHNVDTDVIIEDSYRSPVRKDDLTPISARNLRSVSVSSDGTNVAIGTTQTPYLATVPSAHELSMQTRDTYPDDTFQNFCLSNTHQLINSAATE